MGIIPSFRDPEKDLAVPREIDEIACGRKNALGSLSHLYSGRGKRDFTGPPLDQLGADLALQFSDLH